MDKKTTDQDLEDALEMTFPASDAVVPARPHSDKIVSRIDRQPVQLDRAAVSQLSKNLRKKN